MLLQGVVVSMAVRFTKNIDSSSYADVLLRAEFWASVLCFGIVGMWRDAPAGTVTEVCLDPNRT